jgi:hypothetical protein
VWGVGSLSGELDWKVVKKSRKMGSDGVKLRFQREVCVGSFQTKNISIKKKQNKSALPVDEEHLALFPSRRY